MGVEDQEFRQLVELCLEGSASREEERRLIDAAEASPDRLRHLLDLAAFEAAIRTSRSDPEPFIRAAVTLIGRHGETRKFASVMRAKLEKAGPGRRPAPASRLPGTATLWALVAAGVFLVFAVFRTSSEKPHPATTPPISGRSDSPRAEAGSGSPDGTASPTVARPVIGEPKKLPEDAPAAPPNRSRASVSLSPQRSPAPLEERADPLEGPRENPRTSPGAKSTTVAAVATVEGPLAGSAILLTTDGEKAAEPGKGILPGEGLRTLETPLPVMLRFPDGTRLEAGPGTEILEIFGEGLAQGESLGKRFRVMRGMVRARVAKQPPGQPMVVQTPYGTVKVVGTILLISVDPSPKKGLTVAVEEGRVELRSLSGKVVEVPAGHLAVSGTESELVARPIVAAKKASSPMAILDPGFSEQTGAGGEPLVAPWSSKGPAGIGVDHVNGRGGGNCGYIFDSGGGGAWSEINQTITVVPGTNYTLSCFVQTDKFFKARGAIGIRIPEGAALIQAPFGTMTDYTPVVVKFNSGPNTSLVIYAGFVNNSAQRASWIHVDDWHLAP